jgi:hypothetical protein
MIEAQNMLEERRVSQVFGAAVFILDQNHRVLTFVEQEDKPKTGKKIGDYSVLCETSEPRENPTITMLRGMHEELGISVKTIKEVVDLHDVKVWQTGFMPGVWATVYVVNCKDPEKLESMIGSENLPDGVVMGGWKTQGELESLPIRIGVKNILDKFNKEIFED